jgi:hypothetical protein
MFGVCHSAIVRRGLVCPSVSIYDFTDKTFRIFFTFFANIFL